MVKYKVRQRSIQLFLLAALVLLSATMASAQVAGHINSVWVEHDVKVKGEIIQYLVRRKGDNTKAMAKLIAISKWVRFGNRLGVGPKVGGQPAA